MFKLCPEQLCRVSVKLSLEGKGDEIGGTGERERVMLGEREG